MEETLQKLQVGLDSLAVTRTIEQFRLDDATQYDLFGGVLQEMVLDLCGAVVEQLDTQVGIKQEHHSNPVRCSKFPCSGRSRVSPCQPPKQSK